MVASSPFADGSVIALLVSLSIVAIVAVIIAVVAIFCWCRLQKAYEAEKDSRQGLEGRFANDQFDKFVRIHTSPDVSRSREPISSPPKRVKIIYERDDVKPKPVRKTSSMPPSSNHDAFKNNANDQKEKDSSSYSQPNAHQEDKQKQRSEFVRLDEILSSNDERDPEKEKQTKKPPPVIKSDFVRLEDVISGTESDNRKGASGPGAASAEGGSPGN